MKNFNRIVKEIVEKDLELTVNVETVSTLKNEFLADLAEKDFYEKNSKDPEDKENINTSNIKNVNMAQKENGKKTFHKIKKNERYPYNNNQYENKNSSRPDANHSGVTRNILKDRNIKQNRFPSFHNRNSIYYRNDNFYRNNRYAPKDSIEKYSLDHNMPYQEKSIY